MLAPPTGANMGKGWLTQVSQSTRDRVAVNLRAVTSAESGSRGSSLQRPPFFEALANARSVLIAGAGGGFDVYAGLPLAGSLMDAGVSVHLANLSFTDLFLSDGQEWLADDVATVAPHSHGPDDYFPERTLARWLASKDLPAVVDAFPKTGVQPLRAAYQVLVEHLEIDAIVLIDGGRTYSCAATRPVWVRRKRIWSVWPQWPGLTFQ